MIKRSLFAVLLIAAFVLSACTGAPTPAPVTAPTDAPAAAPTTPPAAPVDEEPVEVEQPSGFSEAPMLAQMVAAGTLPPVEERLPQVPFVVGPGVYMTQEQLPDWQPGKYGGTLRFAHSVANWNPDVFVGTNEPLLHAPKIGVQGIRGNIVEDFTVEDDNKVFTFFMRKGLKWSDGEPVTSEDVRFVYEDVYLNEQLTPRFPARFRTGFAAAGEPMTLEIIDEFTFKITFSEPYGGFLRNLTIEGWNGYTELIRPSHYLKQYHIDYAALDTMQADLDRLNLTDEWWQVFADKNCLNWDNTNPRCAGYPVLNPWMGVPTTSPNLLSFDRNPYYFKVDTEGQQLPYIDKLISQQVENVEMVNMKALTGEVDFMRESTALVKIPLYKESEAQAGFRVVLLDMHVDSSGLRFNQTFADEQWQAVSQDLRFRQAVSKAINRQSIIDSIYFGYASMPMNTVGAENATRDVDGANALLDEMGLTNKNADGYRLYPDGSEINILLEHGAHAPDLALVAELIAQDLRDVGLRMDVKQIDSSLWGTKNAANEIQATVMWSNDIGWDNDITGGNVGRAGQLWADYINTNGDEGEEPPAWVMEAVNNDKTRWGSVSGSDEYNALKDEGFAWSRANLPMINMVEFVKYPLIVNAKLGNVPQGGYAIGANFSIVQMFFNE
jgi:peptide/nickel transport system substrate-binding protein